MKKRFIAFALAAVMVLSSAPAFATDDIAGIYGSDEKFAAGDEKRVAEQDSDRIIEIIGKLDPDGTADREQLAAIIQRFIDLTL